MVGIADGCKVVCTLGCEGCELGFEEGSVDGCLEGWFVGSKNGSSLG